MIALENVTKVVRSSKRQLIGGTKVLDSINAVLPTDRRIAVLGHDRVAKSMLIRMLAGVALPTKGRIVRHARVSFPVGYVGGLSNDLSVRQNIIHVAKIYQADVAEVVNFVKQATHLDREFDRPYEKLSRVLRFEVGTALAYAIPFDVYLLDGAITKGRPAFREQYSAIFEERMKTASAIFSIRDVRTAKRYCDMGVVLHGGSLSIYDNIDDALAAFKGTKPDALTLLATDSEDDGEEDEFFA